MKHPGRFQGSIQQRISTQSTVPFNYSHIPNFHPVIVSHLLTLSSCGFFSIFSSINQCESEFEIDVSVMASSSSSSSRNRNKYDVFLSFRGEDTRDNFTSHLYSALNRKRIETFIDNDLKRGDEISQSLLGTIEASAISIIIFSERYASSGWCLDELLKILECKHDYGQIVIPVFYRVDPSHVRWQTGTFGDYFSKLGERYPEKMQRWGKALTEAANLSGFDSRVIRPESKLIEEIANEILERLDDTFQSYNKDLVGVERPIKAIETLLCIGSAGVYILGIWGIGGIGKTTIADAVFNKISRHFEGSYFAHNVRDAEETGRMKDLQKELLSDVLSDKNVKLNRLARKKVLIVFDDVNHPGQIESLIGRLDQLASGSRIIITTRDKQVLKNCWVSQIYQMKELEYADARKLFSQYAFGGAHLDASYTGSTLKAIEYAQGVPLALKVLGHYRCKRSKEEWESAMRKLEVIAHREIQEVLKISYDSLDDSQKNVFLDISCFLEGAHRDEVISFFDASGFEAKIELSVLEGKSLITFDFLDRIRMHDLLRDMGREIVRKESIDHPGKRSRLWHHKDIEKVLKKNTGTEAIKGISLDMGKVNTEIQINPYTFSKMTELRFLKFYGYENKCMVYSLEGVPFTEVRYFEWHQYPLKTLDIHAENLVSLKMRGSKVKQLWDDVQGGAGQNLVNLKKIDLTYSKLLTKLPDLSLARNLEILNLGYCSSLTETHSSIQYLNKLEVLVLDNCKSLTSLPTSIHSTYLKRLELGGCSNLKNLPEITSCHLRGTLPLLGVGIEELPSSIECLSNLNGLLIYDCTRLENISSSIFKLKSLKFIGISNCSNLRGFPEIPSCNIDETRIERVSSSKLRLENCSSLESLPSSLCMFKSLTSLKIIDCKKLERLPDELGNLEYLKYLAVTGTAISELPESLCQLVLLSKLELQNCSELEYISSSIFKLKSLESIGISNCSNLRGFPEIPSCNIDETRIERVSSSELRLENCSSLESLPSSLCMFKSLTSLKIVDCKKLERLPDELGNLEYLKYLAVTGTAISELPESLCQLALLSKLELQNCSELEYISSSIFKSKSLESIEISDCSNLRGFSEIPSSNTDETGIERVSSSKLTLENCSSLESLPSSLCMFKSLTFLKIVDCKKLERLPDELGNLEYLKYLAVTGTAISELPESLCQLALLSKLELQNCSELEYISSSIFKSKSLESIEISDCSNLRGFPEIPSCNIYETRIERVSSSELRLKNCLSLESLPSSLCMFKSLTSLKIFDCKKLERLPDELGNLEALEELRVKGTAIRELPESLCQLALLSEFVLTNCSELEYISSSIFKLKSLLFIEISDCSNLRGFPEIPSSNIDETGIERVSSSKLILKDCSSLESLPSSLCMFKSLTFLTIVDCKKLERLPDELGNLKYLKYLVVTGTAIREVPESLGRLSSLVDLRLSSSNLERIPESLDQLSSLEYLELFVNISDRIPEYLRSFPTSIPSDLARLWLSVDLRNYLKLDPNELSEIVKDGWMKQSFHCKRWINKSMYFRGNEIPKWFRHQSTGSTVALKTPPPAAASYNKFMGFAFCAVVAFRSVEDDWKRNPFNVFCRCKFESGAHNSWYLGRISYVESDHVFLGSYLFDGEYFRESSEEIFFRVDRTYGPPTECCEVKKCGIHFLYAPRTQVD